MRCAVAATPRPPASPTRSAAYCPLGGFRAHAAGQERLAGISSLSVPVADPGPGWCRATGACLRELGSLELGVKRFAGRSIPDVLPLTAARLHSGSRRSLNPSRGPGGSQSRRGLCRQQRFPPTRNLWCLLTCRYPTGRRRSLLFGCRMPRPRVVAAPHSGPHIIGSSRAPCSRQTLAMNSSAAGRSWPGSSPSAASTD